MYDREAAVQLKKPAYRRPYFWVLAFVVVAIMVYHYMPLRLDRFVGWGLESGPEVVSVKVSGTWVKEHSGRAIELPQTTITDRLVVDEFLGILSGHTMRRRVNFWASGYHRTDFARPSWISAFISFSDGSARNVLFGPERFFSVDGARYRLYGKEIDTVRLWDFLMGHPAQID